MNSQVQISKGLLAGLVGVALAAAFGVVFLLGRASAGRTPVAPPKAAEVPVEVPAAPPELPAPATVPAWAAAPVVKPAPPAPAAAPAPARAAVAPAPRNDPARAAVVAYFKAVEAIQPESSGDPETVAGQIAVGLGKGDTSGIDGMIQQAQDSRSRLAALTPPQPCAAYHKELLASLDDGLDMMRTLKQMMASPNPAQQAPDITSRANAMKARSDSLRNQEQDLKQRYCQ